MQTTRLRENKRTHTSDARVIVSLSTHSMPSRLSFASRLRLAPARPSHPRAVPSHHASHRPARRPRRPHRARREKKNKAHRSNVSTRAYLDDPTERPRHALDDGHERRRPRVEPRILSRGRRAAPRRERRRGVTRFRRSAHRFRARSRRRRRRRRRCVEWRARRRFGFFFQISRTHLMNGRPESAASVVVMRREATAVTATATTTSDGSGSVTLESILRALSARNHHQQAQARNRETTSESRRGGESDAFAVNLRRQLPALMTLLNPVNGARASDGCRGDGARAR